MRRAWKLFAAVLLAAACGDGVFDPTVVNRGLTFFGEVQVVPAEDPVIVASLQVRNHSLLPIERTFPGGCFIERMQVFERRGGDPRLVWDSDDRTEPHACTDDLALVDLAPGELAAPANWRFGARVSELRAASVPPGTYAVAVWFRLDDGLRRVGVSEAAVP